MQQSNHQQSMKTGSTQPVFWVSSLTYLTVLGAGVYYALVSGVGWQPDALVLFAGALLALLALEHFSVKAIGRTAVVLLGVRMLVFEAVAMVDPSGFSRILYLLIPFNAYFCLAKHTSYALGLLYLTAYLARLSLTVPDWYASREHLSSLLMFVIGTIFTISMARVTTEAEANRTRAEHLFAALTVSHQQLTVYAGQAAGLAAAEERNRLARDIHDCLGHYLTAISIQLEKALAFQHRAPQEAEQALWNARGSAKQALQEVRQSVGALRHSAELFSLSRSLTDLTRHLESDRLTLGLHISGDETGVPQLVLMTLYRSAQEALTNIQKHANASRAILRLHIEPHEVRLTVDDDGQGFDPTLLDRLPARRLAHFGLHGIRERLAFVEGVLDVTSRLGEGTSLRITIPRHPRTVRLAPAEAELR